MRHLMTSFGDDDLNEELLDRIVLAQEREDLTDWEIDFLESMYDTVSGGGTLTANQLNKLSEIEAGPGEFHNFDGWND